MNPVVRGILTEIAIRQDAAGMTSAELYRAAGLSKSIYFHLMGERHTNPRMGTVLALLEPLGLTLAIVQKPQEETPAAATC